MIVLDYVRELEMRPQMGAASDDANKDQNDWIIRVPAFLTGPLGLHSNRTLDIMEARKTPQGDSCLELIICDSTFINPGKIVKVQCTLWDEPGVVNKLTTAISHLGINILTVETSGIDSSDYHVVSIIADLTEAIFRPDKPPEGIVGIYSAYSSLFPENDFRCQEIFEHIVAYCGSSIVFTGASTSKPIPLIEIRLLPTGTYTHLTTCKVERSAVLHEPKNEAETTSTGVDNTRATRKPQKHTHNKIALNPTVRTKVRARLGGTSPSAYLLMADTEARVLRLFLLTERQVSTVFHVAVLHVNVPGALQEITQSFKLAGFNILASLLRTDDKSNAIWEATVSYDREQAAQRQSRELSDFLPLDLTSSKSHEMYLMAEAAGQKKTAKRLLSALKLEFVAKALKNVNERLNEPTISAKYEAVLDFPRYPDRGRYEDPETKMKGISLKSRVESPPEDETASERIHPKNRLKRLKLAIKAEARLFSTKSETDGNRFIEPKIAYAKRELIDAVSASLDRRQSPRVFLSYPSSCSNHAKKLKGAIKGLKMLAIEQQDADGSEILPSIYRKIRSCDLFIGIWHPEESQKMEGDEYGVSPWMPFEYGIAMAHGQKCLVLCSARLSQRIWDRIDQGTSKPKYREDDFDKVVETARRWLRDNRPRF